MQFKIILVHAEQSGNFVKVSMNANKIFVGEYKEVKSTSDCEKILQDAISTVKSTNHKGLCHIALYQDGRKVRGYDAWKQAQRTVEFK